MWRKKASVRHSACGVKPNNTASASRHLSLQSRTEDHPDRAAVVLRSKKDVFYLLRGQARSICQEPLCITKGNDMIQLSSGTNPATDQKYRHGSNAANRSRRRSSEPDLMRCPNRVIANSSTLSCGEYRPKRNDYIHSVLFNSTNNLSGRVEPIYVIVSLSAVYQHVSRALAKDRPSVSLSVPAIDHYNLCQKNRINQQNRETRSMGNSPSLSVRSSTTKNFGQCKFRPAKYHQHSFLHEDCYQCTHRPVSQPTSFWSTSAPSRKEHNSLSCPLISP